MRSLFAQRTRSCSLITALACLCLPSAHADSLPVRYVQGTFHGFIELRSEAGRIVASGDSFQTVHGDRITAETLFKFKDGSIDDETTVFTQHRTFHLISDHHIQRGPAFPHPMDVMIDARSGQVTVRSTGKDGKEDVKTEHLTLPLDLANGLIPLVVENMRADAQEMTVSMIVATPKPRLVKLVITNRGEENCAIAGTTRKATHYEIKIDLGGIAGVVAPIIGKAPPNIQLWTVGEQAPTFAKEQGPTYPEGPLMTIQLASPAWPDAQTPVN
jgi:hypothetical protein